MNSSRFEDVIQDLSTKVNLLRTADENARSSLLNDLVNSINNLSENSKNHGIPPPHDEYSMYSNSILSNNDSESSDDFEINQYENLSQIKNCNAELKGAVKESVGIFQSVSKEFLNNSAHSNRTSIIANELDNLRRNLAEAIEESRVSRSSFTSFIEEKSEAKELQEVYEHINRLQSDIMNAGRKLIESEEEIFKTDREHLHLKDQLIKLEGYLGEAMTIEGNNDEKKAACGCELF